jgi:esterase/lipase
MRLSINALPISNTNDCGRYGMNTDTLKTPKRHRLLKAVAAFISLMVLAFFLGPVNEFGAETPAVRPAPPSALSDLDHWLADSESKFPQLRPGTAKGIVWAKNEKVKTPWSVVYIHGFSASRLETAPLAEQVAASLGANLFYTRLTGHGLTGEDMGKASAQDWLADTMEAVHIGRTLGEKVLVISCSTGSTLSTWLGARQAAFSADAFVFISPNFGLKNKMSELINGHWGQQIATAVSGDTIRYEQTDARESVAWTGSYPTKALFPMMALVKKVRESDLASFKSPVLVLYSPDDQTVDPENIKLVFSKLGSEQKTIEAVTYSKSKGQHVLTGDIRDPDSVNTMATQITDWTHSLKLHAR